MAKRMTIAFFIVLGVVILLISGFLLVLFLAPGFSAFGLRYIAQNSHNVFVPDTRLVDVNGVGLGINGSLKIETYEIPIEVCFTSTGVDENQIRYSYKDNFNGLTNSDIVDPSIEISRDAGGVVSIKTSEYHKFVYESTSSERLLKIYLPMAFVVSSSIDLDIKSTYSNVSFTLEDKNDTRVPNFNNLSIETSGWIGLNNKINAITYKQTCDGTITIGTDDTKTISATNYILDSGRGKINISRDIVGDLEVKSNGGAVTFVSCKNLVANTGDGGIYGYGEVSPVVNGIVKIESKAGSVNIGKVLGTGVSSISTNSGNVVIDKISDAVITTTRGSVYIKSLNSANITTNVGKVTVEEALSSVNVETKRGNIYLGGEGVTLNSPTAFSRLGKVFVYSASGKADIQTISGNIEFTNTDCDETKISCGGKLVATNLSGKVTISSQKNIDVSFESIDADVVVELADTVTFAKISALNNNAYNTRFILTGKNVTRFERSANGTFSKAGTGTDLSSEASVVGPLLKVSGTNAEIEVYFNSL